MLRIHCSPYSQSSDEDLVMEEEIRVADEGDSVLIMGNFSYDYIQ